MGSVLPSTICAMSPLGGSMGKLAIDDRKQLTKDANKLLDQNLAAGEVVRAIIRGTFSSAAICTDRRVFVSKQGMMGGALFGKKLTSYDYRNLTGVHLETGVVSGVFALEGPGISSHDLSYWSQGKGDPGKAPHALALNRDNFEQAKAGVALLRRLIADAQQSAYSPAPAAPASVDVPDQIRKLGELRDAGFLTAAEFESKKAELLARL
jgi:Short C-terminal domain